MKRSVSETVAALMPTDFTFIGVSAATEMSGNYGVLIVF